MTRGPRRAARCGSAADPYSACPRPGNHPAVHVHWLEAVALGYAVAVRPSRREPFTAHRLVSALQEAGFGPDQVAFLPTDHDAAPCEMLTTADLSIVYGGDDVVRKYSRRPVRADQRAGPFEDTADRGRDWGAHLDMLADSVSHGGGTGCVAATAFYVEGDARPLARALAERLSAIPGLPPEDDKGAAASPLRPERRAGSAKPGRGEAGDAVPVLGTGGIADDLGKGGTALQIAVYLLRRAGCPAGPDRVAVPVRVGVPVDSARGHPSRSGTASCSRSSPRTSSSSASSSRSRRSRMSTCGTIQPYWTCGPCRTTTIWRRS